MLTMVWLFPVPGGPSTTSPGPERASITACSWEGSLSAVKYLSISLWRVEG